MSTPPAHHHPASASASADGSGEDVIAPLSSHSHSHLHPHPHTRPAGSSVSNAMHIPPTRTRQPTYALGSMDLSDESRDTVEMKDSDTWYPQFSPSASLGPVKKLEADKRFGLSELLSKRMAPSAFHERFLKPGSEEEKAANANMALITARAKMAAAETNQESLFNRGAKLGALLAKRPEAAALEKRNIIRTPQGAGAKSASSPSGAGSASLFAAMQAQLEISQKKDKLNNFLGSRMSKEAMMAKGHLKDEQKQSEPKERLASAKTTLGDFLGSRPSPEQLVNQKIITDIGDLPGGLERKQDNALVPTLVHGGSLAGKQVTNISLGFSHTLALDSDGGVHVFGSGANGRLGVGEGAFGEIGTPQQLPAAVFGGERVSAVDAGENHSAAITASGKLYCWGCGTWGRLGTGNQDDVGVPRLVPLPDGHIAKAVSCGAYHTLVLSTAGQLFAFGWNKGGRCGLGRKHSTLVVLTPVAVPFFAPPVAAPAAPAEPADADSSPSPPAAPAKPKTITIFEAGQNSSFATTAEGELYTWGTGSFGVLGLGDENDVWEPAAVPQLSGQVLPHVALGSTHMLAVNQAGDLLSWGHNEKHQLGRAGDVPQAAASASAAAAAAPSAAATASLQPGRVSLPSGISAVGARWLAAGKSHSFLVDSNGRLHSFGLGSRGILGLGSETDEPTPKTVTSLQDSISRADAAWTHSAAITDGGKLFTWGAKNNGRLGF